MSLRTPIEGPGRIRIIQGTDPAGTGAEISETVPTNARWQVLCVLMTLASDANAANRFVQLIFDDAGAPLAPTRSVCPAAQTASQSRTYLFATFGAKDTGFETTTGTIMLPLPHDVFLRAGDRFRTLTNGIQATDNYESPVYLVREWIEE